MPRPADPGLRPAGRDGRRERGASALDAAAPAAMLAGDTQEELRHGPSHPAGKDLLAGIVLLLIAGAAALAIRTRRPGTRDGLRRFVSHRFNPLVVRFGMVGGRRSPWSFIEHVGRRSGTTYRTPVLPLRDGTRVFIPLPYGDDVQWALNVRAAGHSRLQRHATVLELDEPVVVSPHEVTPLPAWYRSLIARRGMQYLRLNVLRELPGSLDPDVADRAAEPAAAG
jgi:deazaflavin-dependent oxidoreductase (nitroreductase family)